MSAINSPNEAKTARLTNEQAENNKVIARIKNRLKDIENCYPAKLCSAKENPVKSEYRELNEILTKLCKK